MSCTSVFESLIQPKVKASEVQHLVNSLHRGGWEDVVWESNDDGTYEVSASKEQCMCLPNTPVQMMLLVLEKIGDADIAKKHWRTALKVYNG